MVKKYFYLFFILFSSFSFAANNCENQHSIKKINLTLSNSSDENWNDWNFRLKKYRQCLITQHRVSLDIYNSSEFLFRQYFLFMYDQEFQEKGSYKTLSFLSKLEQRYGHIDSVLLWHAYPQLGFDERKQFDFYRQMPGGLRKLKAEVIDPLHKKGIKVFINYNPWDVGTYQELAQIVSQMNVDGVMLDTMNNVPTDLVIEINKVKKGVILMPEVTPSLYDHGLSQASWAQWYIVDKKIPSILFQKWLFPSHQMFSIGRWNTSRKDDIVYSFFNATGVLIWDNVFGSWNPYSQEDRILLAQTGELLKNYNEPYFKKGEWLPLIPSPNKNVDINVWVVGNHIVAILRNRSQSEVKLSLDKNIFRSRNYFAFWMGKKIEANQEFTLAADSVEMVASDLNKANEIYLRFLEQTKKVSSYPQEQNYIERIPIPHRIPLTPNKKSSQNLINNSSFVFIPGGPFKIEVKHKKRESGCYPFGGERGHLWGWNFEDIIKHSWSTSLASFYIKKTAVTNQEFIQFVKEANYIPLNPEAFLAHIPRNSEGELPNFLSPELAPLPVTFVNLEDAKAYANWKGERLLTEEEWQYAGEGAGLHLLYPFGNNLELLKNPEVINLSGKLEKANAHPQGGTPQGVLGMTGNSWEWTDSLYTDGHNKFTILKGGSFLPDHHSGWIIQRGPRPNNYHAKYFITDSGLDRSATISFRTAR